MLINETTLENKKADYNKRLDPSYIVVENYVAQCTENGGKYLVHLTNVYAKGKNVSTSSYWVESCTSEK